MDKYERLEGKTVIVEGIEGIVVGCDKDVGLTIVDKNDKNHYLLCLVGPSSPNWKSFYVEGTYHKIMNLAIDMINSGHIYYDYFHINNNVGTFYSSAETCAFGQ